MGVYGYSSPLANFRPAMAGDQTSLYEINERHLPSAAQILWPE